MVFQCRVCNGHTASGKLTVREMMFGYADPFEYEQCDDCESLQIAEIPSAETLGRYYPDSYYSRAGSDPAGDKSGLRKALRQRRILHKTGCGSLTGCILSRIAPEWDFDALIGSKAHFRESILDVGCGAGANLLGRMARAGFRQLLGADPFVAADLTTEAGVRVLKREIGEVPGAFDLIMFHHSFEHVASPRAALTAARSRLTAEGRCLIRIPTPSSDAFCHYGTDWVQWDAPRHLTLISRRGMAKLVEDCGFIILSSHDDSSAFQYTGSELYRRGVPLVRQSPTREFTDRQRADFARQAAEANLRRRGDQVAYLLRPA